MNRIRIIVGVFLLIISLSLISCISVNVKNNQPSPQFVKVALLTPTSQATAITPTYTPIPTTPSPSLTFPPSPSLTQTNTPSPTLTQTNTEIPEPVTGITNKGSRCRKGPGIVYDHVTYLDEGALVQVDGRNTEISWLSIMFTDLTNTPINCWINISLLSTAGNLSDLQVIPDPPTPRPTLIPTTEQPSKPPPRSTPPINPVKTPTPVPPPPYPAP